MNPLKQMLLGAAIGIVIGVVVAMSLDSYEIVEKSTTETEFKRPDGNILIGDQEFDLILKQRE